MGEKQNQPFPLFFDPSLRVDFQGSRAFPDAGLLLALPKKIESWSLTSGPDRAATATGGIANWWPKSAAESVYGGLA